LVALIGWWLLRFDFPVAAKYAAVVMLAALSAVTIHHFLIRPFAVTRLLFNGERRWPNHYRPEA
jgi:glucans biosynthesis protein C